jgi:hypothetical protein
MYKLHNIEVIKAELMWFSEALIWVINDGKKNNLNEK